MRQLQRLNDLIARVEGILLSVFLLGMIGLAFLQVVMRNVFDAGIPWADTVVRHLVLWVGFLGAALATKLDQHLTLEVVTKFLPERARHLTSILVKLFAGYVTFYLLCASIRFIESEQSVGGLFIGLFPSWWALSIIPLTFALIPFHLALGIAKDVQYFVKGKT